MLEKVIINGFLGVFLFAGIMCTISGARHNDLNYLAIGFIVIITFAVAYGPIQRLFK
jgi:hypothetical protein